MIILRKKRILIIIVCLVVSLGVFSLKNNLSQNTVPTVALPTSGKVVVIDAGHGIPDEGGYFIEVSRV